MFDVIVVGAGPAGLTAAIYLRRAEKSVLVLEAKAHGGQIINTPEIENYPACPHVSGFEFAERTYNQAIELGAEVVYEKAIEIRDDGKVKTVIASGGEYMAKAVIIATGSESRKLGVSGEDELIGRGISYCATCDGAFFRKKPVAVVGGGNTAVEDALYLSDIAEKVYLIHRRDTFRAEEGTLMQLKKKENVEFVLNSTVKKLNAEKRLESIEVESGGNVRTISVKGLFVAIGRIPETRNLTGLLKLDEAGYVVAGEDCVTERAGIFVAGDNRTKTLRQLVTATADGAAAATAAARYINSEKSR